MPVRRTSDSKRVSWTCSGQVAIADRSEAQQAAQQIPRRPGTQRGSGGVGASRAAAMKSPNAVRASAVGARPSLSGSEWCPAEAPRRPGRPSRAGRLRAFDGGRDGRTLLDRVLDAAPDVLAPGGTLLVVHSGLCGVDSSLARLRAAGLSARVSSECQHPFGPELTRRAGMLEARGLIASGVRTERLVVLAASSAAYQVRSIA